MAARPVPIDLVLLPVDGSDESLTAVEYAVAVAAKYDARIHMVYVLNEDVVRGIEAGAVDTDAVVADTDSFIDAAMEIADEADIPVATSTAYGFSTTRKTRHPGSVILDTAEALEADFIVIPREHRVDEPAGVLEKAAEYVLLYASQPVLSV